MLAEKKALVAGVDNDGVFRQTLLIQEIQDAPDTFIHRQCTAKVVMHDALVFPADEISSLEMGGLKRPIAGAIVGIPQLALLWG